MKKVNLKEINEKIEVFYDGHCGMCRTFIEWLRNQNQAMDVACYDYHGDETAKVFPNIGEYDPSKEIVVRVDGDTIYTGAEGWVCCLWSCKRYRFLARVMNNRLLLPVVKKLCYFISKNRLTISKVVFRKKNREIAEELEGEKKRNVDIECDGGCEK